MQKCAVATLRAEYRDRSEAGVLAGDRSDLLVASSEAGRAFRPSVAATAESRALVSFTRGHAYEAGAGERRAPAFRDCRSLGRNRKRRASRSMNEGPLSTPVLRRDGAWLREVVARRHGRRRSSGRMWGAGGRYGPRVGWWWCGAVPMSLSLHQVRGPGVIGARSGGACQKRTVRQSGEKWRLPERRA